MNLTGRTIFPGFVSGEALVSKMGISFYGGVDPDTGIITEVDHDLEGQSIAGIVLVFPSGKGSTVGSYILYRLQKNGKAPLGIINTHCETITAVGCIIAEIPCVDQVDINRVQSGMLLTIEAEQGHATIKLL
jgi:predicted aconitase with swiveling domain